MREFINQTAMDSVTALYNAIECGCTDIVLFLIEKDAVIDINTSNGSNSLHAAVNSHCLEMVKIIHSMSPHLLEQPNNDRETPLFKAVSTNYVACYEYFKECSVTIDYQRSDGCTILHIAIMNDSMDIIHAIASDPVDISKLLHLSSNADISPLLLVTQRGNMDIIRLFRSLGAKINHVSKDGSTVLNCAVQSRKLEVLKYFLSETHKFSINMNVLRVSLSQRHISEPRTVIVSFRYGYSCLVQAINLNCFDIADYLWDYLTNEKQNPLFWRNELERNILHEVAIAGSVESVQYVIKKAPELLCEEDIFRFKPIHLALNEKTCDIFNILFKLNSNLTKQRCIPLDSDDGITCPLDRWTVLHASIGCGHTKLCQDVLEKLDSYGININDFDYSKRTPLVIAIGNSDDTLVNSLLKKGADPNITSIDRYPLEIAIESNNKLIASRLIKYGAKTTIITSQGGSLLHCAISKRNTDFIDFLLTQEPSLANICDNHGRSPLHFGQLNALPIDSLNLIRSHTNILQENVFRVNRTILKYKNDMRSFYELLQSFFITLILVILYFRAITADYGLLRDVFMAIILQILNQNALISSFKDFLRYVRSHKKCLTCSLVLHVALVFIIKITTENIEFLTAYNFHVWFPFLFSLLVIVSCNILPDMFILCIQCILVLVHAQTYRPQQRCMC